MKFIEIPVQVEKFGHNSKDRDVLESVLSMRQTTKDLQNENRTMDALERTVESMRVLKGFSDYGDTEFRVVLSMLLFDLSELYYELKDYKQSRKELETLFYVLENMIKADAERFGEYHILAMELSARILRSRKKALDMLAKQQIAASVLYDKVNAGVVAAIDKLVDTLRNIGELLVCSGDYKAALKFYSEAIRLSKKRAGKVTRKEIKMTVDMAKVMMRMGSMRPRALRLLEAVLPHAIALETLDLEEDILALTEIINTKEERDTNWKLFLHKLKMPFMKEKNVKKSSKSSAEAAVSKKKEE